MEPSIHHTAPERNDGAFMLNAVVAGRVIVGIAVITLVVALVGTAVAQHLVRDFHLGVEQSLTLTADVLGTVDESFVVAEDALVIIGEGVTDAETAVRSLGGSMEEGQVALESVTALTGVEIADALEDVEQALPAVQQAASAIDDTLATLSLLPFGLTYTPDRPLGDSIGDIADGLEGLPDELRTQADQVERTSAELADATSSTIATADSLAALDERIDAAAALVGGYAERATDAALLVDRQRDALDTTATRARGLIIAFGLLFALGQFGPIYLGSALARGSVAPPHGSSPAIIPSPGPDGR
jgi:methyl-accepting chemotaxis protein